MIRLFAGLGGDGAMRFIGEVERGAACGCRCPECGSPLVAKQGNEKEWHFAHEGGQERPECEAGAINMLRRLAVEYLRAQPALEFPQYRERVQVRSSLRELTEEVAWKARIVGAVEWLERPPKSAPVGRANLETGDELEIFVEIGDQPSHGYPPGADAKASVLFWSPLPVVSDLRERLYAEQHLRHHGQFIWRHHPDSLHIAEAARARLRAQATQDDEQVERARQHQAAEAGRKWAGIAGRLQQRPPDEVHPSVNREPEASFDGLKRPEALPQSYDWAPDQKVGSGFILYRLRDGSAWVVYTLRDASHAIAAWPRAEDGWDEALPPSVGTPDLTLGVYRTSDLVATMTFLAPRADIVRATSDPREFEAAVR
ncbi:MAG: competence protein CoiA family protein [Burkholderiales bacterium]